MSGKPSRDKGARGEREVCHVLRDHGYEVERTPNSGGLWLPGDVQGVPGLHIEVKRQERWVLRDWMRQAESDCVEPNVPLVVFRSSREPWYACLWFADFLNIWQGREQC